MAIGWEIYERTGSALALGLVGLTLMVPMFLFTLPAGHVADNYNRKRIIVLMTAVMAAASLGVAVDFGAPGAGLLDLRLPVHRRHRPHVFVGGQRRLFAGAGGPEGFPARGELERRHVPTVQHCRAGDGGRHHRLDVPASRLRPPRWFMSSMRWRRWSFACSSAWCAGNTPSPSRNP